MAARHAEGQSGQVVAIVAMMIMAMVGMMGLIVDGGLLLAERRGAQLAADAAAIAASYDLMQGKGSAAAIASALYYAAENGYDNDGTTNVVSVSIPPTSGSYAGNASFVQVTITTTLNTYFIQAVYTGAANTSASATAGTVGAPSPYSLIALNSTACNALQIGGSAELEVEDAGIVVNSSCTPNAFSASGSAEVEAKSISVVGGYQIGGSASVSPTPQTGVEPITDPLASVPAPSFAGLTVRNGSVSNPVTLRIGGNRNQTLQPGIYYGGIEISGNARVTLQPGTYIMAGGGFKFLGSGWARGNGVFMYNTQDATQPIGDGAYGPISLSGSGDVELSPPASGTYKGFLFFQDRSNANTFTVSSSEDREFDGGTLYFPAATCNLSGSGEAEEIMQLICDRISLSGSAELEIEYDDDLFYAVPSAALVE